MQRIISTLVLSCFVLSGTALAEIKPGTRAHYNYAGKWRGYKAKSNGIGVGAATLIAPSWAITAKHLAVKKARAPGSVNVKLTFQAGVERQVKKVYLCPGVDMALLRLGRPIGKVVQPVALCSTRLDKKHGTFPFTFVSRGHKLKVVKGRRGKGNGNRIYHSKDSNGKRPGSAGDSGGGWVFERKSPDRDILFAVIHGGGMGPQVAAQRKWIDKIVGDNSKEKIQWAPHPRKGK